MFVVVTGGAGFIGRSVVRQLAARGDHVVAVVRDPDAAAHLADPRVDVVSSDLRDVAVMTEVMRGADGVIHAAGSYRIGIPASERPAMLDANVGTAQRVLDAGIAAAVPRMVYLSTAGIFGNTMGQIVDETYRRDPARGFTSYYDETKWLAHLEVERRIAAGAPIVIAQPGGVYGPGDHSGVGHQLRQAYLGTLPFIGLGRVGVSFVHVDDLVTGLLAALDRGLPGRSYVLGGPNVRLADALTIAAKAGGRRPPRLRIPDAVLRVGAFLAPHGGAMFGLDPNLREIARASIGVTYWASSARAAAELGYATRGLADGFADAFGPAGPPPPGGPDAAAA
jgi:nucleoside-diphosphate-sugar epimerase